MAVHPQIGVYSSDRFLAASLEMARDGGARVSRRPAPSPTEPLDLYDEALVRAALGEMADVVLEDDAIEDDEFRPRNARPRVN